MTEDNIRALLFWVFVIIAFGGVIFIRAFFTRRAVFNVIEIFYQHNALRINDAKTRHELGLERRDLLQRMTKPRDYKQHALQILIHKGIVCENEDGSLYMDEKGLDQSVRSKPNDLHSQGRSS